MEMRALASYRGDTYVWNIALASWSFRGTLRNCRVAYRELLGWGRDMESRFKKHIQWGRQSTFMYRFLIALL